MRLMARVASSTSRGRPGWSAMAASAGSCSEGACHKSGRCLTTTAASLLHKYSKQVDIVHRPRLPSHLLLQVGSHTGLIWVIVLLILAFRCGHRVGKE